MQNCDYFKFDKYLDYLEFLDMCKTRNYSNDLVLHEHHIIPKSICCDDNLLNSKRNLINLSVEDHIKAHLMLADIFEEGTYENLVNLRAARVLNKKSITDKTTLLRIREAYKGSNNPFYGKTHSLEVIKALRERTKAARSGKTYREIYGEDKFELEKRKRAKPTRTPEQYAESGKKISAKAKGTRTGKDNSWAQPYIVDGKEYSTRKEVEQAFKKPMITIKKYHDVIKLPKTQKSK